jgi:predicted  nucleic acid-binding Zn-ribbon protein
MKPQRTTATRGFAAWLNALAIAGTALLLAACAANDTPPTARPKPGDGIAEYRAIAVTAGKSIRSAMEALEAVRALPTGSPAALSRLSKEVNDLQVESAQMRARTQAIQERGNEWFQRWHEKITEVEDPQLRARINECRPQLEAGFNRIKSLGQEGREAFNPFLAELRQIRNALERNPAAAGDPALQATMQSAATHGATVEQRIHSVIRELDAMKALFLRKGDAK